jgi:hypothetical protein
MLKKMLAVCVLLLIAVPVSAEMMTFEKEVEEIVANDQSREQVEAFALQKAKRLAVEEAGTYISSLTVVANAMMQKDEITALASGVVQAKIVGVPDVQLKNGVIHITVKARIQVDTGVLDKQVAELLKEKGTVKKLEDEQKKVRELENRLANLKSSELKRLEELNAQAVVMEQERDRRRLANAEMALQAQGELKKAEIERLQKERALNERTANMIADQEQQRKNEAATLAQEQDRIRRAQLENEQRWNDLTRKSQLAQQQWVAIDDSLSLKQALAEAQSIKSEIATLKQRSEFQFEESIRTLKAAYQQQIAVTSPKMPQPLAEKDPFESTAAYNARRGAFETAVQQANEGSAEQVEKLKGEENLKLAQAKLDYLEQQIKVLRPFIQRLKALQARMFVLPGEVVTVELGPPDADRSCFPTTITHNTDRWTVDWKYSDTNKARDIYKTRTFLKAEAMVQLTDAVPNGYVMTEARVTHPGTGEQQRLEVAQPTEFTDVSAFERASGVELAKARKYVLYELMINLHCKETTSTGFTLCKDVIIDARNGLQWARNANISGSPMTWKNAVDWTRTLSHAGLTGWRLPSKDELVAIVERGGNRPSEWLNGNGFDGVQSSLYWSSSSYASSTADAWFVYVSDGYVGSSSKAGYGYIWPVRAGQF